MDSLLYMNSKICNNCQETKSLDNFYFYKNEHQYNGNCRPCKAKKAKERRNNNQDIKDKMKQSQKKYYEKNKEKLNKTSRAYHEKNKEKTRELCNQYYKDNADKLKEKARINRERLRAQALSGQLKKPSIKEKTCTNCNLTKDVSNFTFRKTRNIYESVCKTCNMERERERRKLNKDKINARRREIKKPLTLEQRIKHNLRKRVNRYIEQRDGKNLYLKLLGCNKQFLIKWFEYNFKLDEHLDINWDNYGTHWHIDHVTPCASFDMNNEEQQKECFHWTNLSPVLKSYNLSKGDKIKPIDQIRQEIRIKNFLNTADLNNKKYKYSTKS